MNVKRKAVINARGGVVGPDLHLSAHALARRKIRSAVDDLRAVPVQNVTKMQWGKQRVADALACSVRFHSRRALGNDHHTLDIAGGGGGGQRLAVVTAGVSNDLR